MAILVLDNITGLPPLVTKKDHFRGKFRKNHNFLFKIRPLFHPEIRRPDPYQFMFVLFVNFFFCILLII